MKKLTCSISTLLLVATLCAQDTKHAIALMPFVSASDEFKPTAIQVQDVVLQQLAGKPNVEVVDRSKDKIVIAELDNQIRAVSVAAKDLAEQGKLRGAKKIIVGHITQVNTEAVDEFGSPVAGSASKSSSSKTNKNDKSEKSSMNLRYSGLVTFSLQLIDVETGLVLEQSTFTGNTMPTDAANKTGKGLGALLKKKLVGETASLASQVIMPETKEKAIQAAIHSSEKEISEWVNKIFANSITLVSVEERSKGVPSIVLVAGLDNAVNKGTQIAVLEVRYLDAGGKKVKQEKKIATLKVQEAQGEVTQCKVVDGGKELEGKIGGANQLVLKLN